ncbi:hypothetical protein K7432_017200 [Basidiobolus ranarum]|uniref:Uncharacterized protein n=1 Tax=Basidiobolus ranarum TaxID=34480 RepID=A0ABR2WDP0_9FUNG
MKYLCSISLLTIALVSRAVADCTESAVQCSGDAIQICSNGDWVNTQCATGTVCQTADDSTSVCGFPDSGESVDDTQDDESDSSDISGVQNLNSITANDEDQTTDEGDDDVADSTDADGNAEYRYWER